MAQSIDDQGLLAFGQYPVANQRHGIGVARAHRRLNLLGSGSAPVERRFAEPHLDPPVTRQRLVHLAHGGEELDETDQRRRRRPADRVVPDLAQLCIRHRFAGHVAVDHRLLAAGAEFDHHVAHVPRKARIPHDGRVELHLLGKAVRVAQGHHRVIAEGPEQAVERRLDTHAISTGSRRLRCRGIEHSRADDLAAIVPAPDAGGLGPVAFEPQAHPDRVVREFVRTNGAQGRPRRLSRQLGRQPAVVGQADDQYPAVQLVAADIALEHLPGYRYRSLRGACRRGQSWLRSDLGISRGAQRSGQRDRGDRTSKEFHNPSPLATGGRYLPFNSGPQRLGGVISRRMPPAILPSVSSPADMIAPPLANTRL